MKNGYSEFSDADVGERNDRAKKLYRYLNDVARRIDEATVASHSVSDLFTIHFEIQRQKLRDNCEKLIFLDPINYGKKSLELLWRKVYYDTVSTAKKLLESDNTKDSYLFTHIVCGIGHFHHLISKLQSDVKVKFKELDYSYLFKDDEEIDHNIPSNNGDYQQCARSLLHSCLIYLGDLSRYQTEMFNSFDSSIASRYYHQAALIDTSLGMPFNQLGNLYLEKNHNLDSVCYYVHCLSCTIPFDGAFGNLTKIFEKNSEFIDTLHMNDNMSQSEYIQMTVAHFLSLIDIWYLGKDENDISNKCSMTAELLKMSMDFQQHPLPDINESYDDYTQALEEENLNPSYLNNNLIHKVVQLCLFTIAKMNEIDETKAFACKAFTLALFSQLLHKYLQVLQEMGLKNPADKHHRYPKPIEANHKESESQNNILQTEEIDNSIKTPSPTPDKLEPPVNITNGDAKSTSKKNLKRRRRRRTATSDSSDGSDFETESDLSFDDSCSEEMSVSSLNSEDEKSEDSLEETSDVEDQTASKLNGSAHSIEELEEDSEIKEGTTFKTVNTEQNSVTDTQTELNLLKIENFLTGNNFLPSLKLIQDWVVNEKELILSCNESGESLFQCLVDLLNTLTYYFKPKNKDKTSDSCKLIDQCRLIAKKMKLEYTTIPLPEDINLRGTNICKYDKDAAEWQLLDIYKPSIVEENVIRILKFIDFGEQIAKIVSRIRFNRTLQVLYWKKLPTAKTGSKLHHKRGREWHNSTKPQEGEGGLLRRLGRLWLTAQLRELERYGCSTAPTLLALDAPALHKHLRKIKQLLRTKLFILLVPTVVLQELDDLKRDNSTARDAIRWLEVQLQGGSRFVRAQKTGQSRPLPLLKYPRKAPPHIHNFIQILEFCHHFIADDKQGGNGDPDNSVNKSTPLLVLLTGNEPGGDEEYKEFSLTGAAKAAGVTVECIGNFYSKWRQSAHKTGKKR